jgi:16S rRNA (guanine527-N7)-methyltransferase
LSDVPDAAISQEVAALLERSREYGFLGPQPIARQVEHALDFWRAIVASGLAPSVRLLDLGSGGGLPGLVLLEKLPTVPIVLLDSSQRRTGFLSEAVAELGVEDRVQVLCGRAEELGHDPSLRAHFDLVVSRSFGSPAVVAECASPFLVSGGHLVVSEPPEGLVSDRWPEAGTRLTGLGPVSEVVTGSRFAVLSQREPCPDRLARRVGVPTKKPLF